MIAKPGNKTAAPSWPDQSGTKPKLVAKILVTNFGVFFVIYVVFFFLNVQYESNKNVIKGYYGSGISHDWDMSFEKFKGLPCGSFLRKLTPRQGQINFSKYESQWARWCSPVF